MLNPKQQSKYSKTGQSQSHFLPGLISYRGQFFGGGWEKRELGGRSRIRPIECRLRPFNKLRYFHGIRPIKMCDGDITSSKIPAKMLESGEFEHLTAGR